MSENIKEIDRLFVEAPTPELYRRIFLLNWEFERLSVKKTEPLFFHIKEKLL